MPTSQLPISAASHSNGAGSNGAGTLTDHRRMVSPRDHVGLPERLPLPPIPGVRSATASDTALGQKIRGLRRARVLTQKELAAMVGVTGAQLHRYETGGTRIAASRLVALAQALGVRADTLIGSCTTEPPPPPPAVFSSGDELLELIQIFSGLTDPRHRSAVLSIARMFPVGEAAKTSDEL
jgi:transcriptional regulator with XRE-family HTH domain